MTDFNDDLEVKQVEATEAAKALRQRDINDITYLMGTAEGRRFIWRQLSLSGVFTTSFTGETNSTMFNEGRRNYGLNLFSDVMDACPNEYMIMANEAKEDSKQ
ncbi:hypothetical protein CH54_1410 [Yersinia rochesterensis]|uniref:Bbp19-like phage domain-containing protein n=1 Tax=Yersinia rochesterensis TaxID=1604335 RepID=A0ABN4FJK2_9GAMM|nr:hypothetical protein [Yersinia rochesterensis]AIN17501.1 hypothetical protein DJ57_2257 [Yersinia rochesterensis]AJI85577.1 hypothetical protein AW19_254 [Yersinia frederiksenii Y225]AJJ37255.1 hypothetical protein CH54_1410 [Yersinia rochesterensis]